jgi:fructose-bisphosphate aldolase class 1
MSKTKIIADLKAAGEESLAKKLVKKESGSKVDSKRFFSAYAKVARKVKGISKLKGEDQEEATNLLSQATKNLEQLDRKLAGY